MLAWFHSLDSGRETEYELEANDDLMRYLTFSLFALGIYAPLAHAAGDYDTYGGWMNLKGEKTGYFHTQQINGRWWLVTPEGNAFFSKGVDNVSYAPESDNAPKAPADPVAWAKGLCARICKNAQLAGTWAFDPTGHLLSLIHSRLTGGRDGQDSSVAESPGVAKARGGEVRAFSDGA